MNVMKTIRRILLILDASLSRTPAVERAVAFSRKTGASLWVGLFDRGPRLGVLGILDRADARASVERAGNDRRRRGAHV